MRALLAALILLAAPAVAAAKPLDDDRSFARDGIFLVDELDVASGVVAHPDGGTLYATYEGLLRLSATGRRLEAPPPAPAGILHELIPGLALGVVTPTEFGKPLPVGVWRLAPDGTTLAHHRILVPGGRSATAVQAVPRGEGYALLLRVNRPNSYRHTLRIAALTAGGELDTAWADGGYHPLAERDASIGAGPDGSVVIATDRTTQCVNRKVRPVLHVERLAPDGDGASARTHVLGRKQACTSAHPGEIHVDRRGRITIAGGLGRYSGLLRLRGDLRRDRRFGLVRVTRRPTWWQPMALAPRRGGGFGVGFTTTNSRDVPHAHAALVTSRGRVLRARRLRATRSHPTSEVLDVAFDGRGRLVVAGALRDRNFYIREDYGEPSLAVWRLRTR